MSQAAPNMPPPSPPGEKNLGREAVDVDVEVQDPQPEVPSCAGKDRSTFKSLGLLDRYLAVWIFLSMLLGILLGNFVPSVGPALQQGKFVEVSVPIGKSPGPVDQAAGSRSPRVLT